MQKYMISLVGIGISIKSFKNNTKNQNMADMYFKGQPKLTIIYAMLYDVIQFTNIYLCGCDILLCSFF